jgi:L-amino acid N-acyltransferase YncA
MEEISFKSVDEADLPAILDIYNHYIRTTTATFRLQPIPMETLRTFILIDHHRYKDFVMLRRGEVAGFCFLSQYKDLQAYDRTAYVGVYLKPGFTGRGLGTETVRYLEKAASAGGIKTVIASISGENIASIRLFRKLGYEECGHLKRVGEKFGRVIDVVLYQRMLDAL